LFFKKYGEYWLIIIVGVFSACLDKAYEEIVE